MKNKIIIFIISVFTPFLVNAQRVNGQIISETGEGISFATIFVYEKSLGVVANEKGEFQIELEKGTYTIEARSLAFKPGKKMVEVSNNPTSFTLVLEDNVIEIDEVNITPGKENPAYRIMRQAIARAPYHRYNVESYKSDVYLKGSGKLEKIPRLAKRFIKDKQLLTLIDKLLVIESHSKVEFRSPDHYKQEVLAHKSSIPKELEPKSGGLELMNSSIYDEKYNYYISPLSKDALRYYKFKLKNIFNHKENQIYQIEIIPTISKATLYSGDIYIVDGVWAVYALDLKTKDMGTQMRHNISFQQIKPDVFLPITYTSDITIDMMGVKGFLKLYSSVKYSDIKVKDAAKQSEKTQEVKKILTKEKLSNHDSKKIAKLNTQIHQSDEIRKNKESLQIIDSSKIKVSFDSLSSLRDSTYWEQIRKVPLKMEEVASYKMMDSFPPLKSMQKTDSALNISIRDDKFKFWKIIMGGNSKLSNNLRLKYSGLLRGALKEYNFADGFWLGQEFSLLWRLKNKNNLSFSPQLYYTTARRDLVWQTDIRYSFAPLRNGYVAISAGDKSSDIQPTTPQSRVLNSLSSLILAENFIRFNREKNFGISAGIDIINGMYINVNMAHKRYYQMDNITEYNFAKNRPEPNIPLSTDGIDYSDHISNRLDISLSYTPKNYYKIIDGRKNYVRSAWPTFFLNLNSAIKIGGNKNQSRYSAMSFGVRQSVKTGEWSRFIYDVRAGGFLSKPKLYATDYKYFYTDPLFITLDNAPNKFALLPNYTSTSSAWVETHARWESDYLLLKRISFLQTLPIRESLQLNFLYEKSRSKPYTELGYNINLIGLFKVGIYTAFEGFTYCRFGVKVGILIF